MKFSIIVACDLNCGIGKDGEMPWALSEDMKFFKKTTITTKNQNKKNVVVMGRKTWDSLNNNFRPLEGRLNVVLTRSTLMAEAADLSKVEVLNSFDELALFIEENEQQYERVFIIGGGQIYQEVLDRGLCDEVYLTRVHNKFECDAFFPNIEDKFNLESCSDMKEENGIRFQFCLYKI